MNQIQNKPLTFSAHENDKI